MPERVTVSVRQLVEFLLRGGDIDSGAAGGRDRMAQGSALHRRLQQEGGKHYRPEVFLTLTREVGGVTVTVEGRADGILEEEEGSVTVDEIKTTTSPLDGFAEDYPDAGLNGFLSHDARLHWAQAMCYAYITAVRRTLKTITVRLTYFQMTTEEQRQYFHRFTLAELEAFYLHLLAQFSRWAVMAAVQRKKRDDSLRELPFPFAERRPGQQEMMDAVADTAKNGQRLFCQAPTGIGKTISAVYPAVAALGAGHIEKFFYLTAKANTRSGAERAAERLREGGAVLKTITLTAKDKICFLPHRDCRPESCPYASGHYSRVNAALEDLLKGPDAITRTDVAACAERHTVCPFELQLDASLWCDGIIGDYNHAFHPQACLHRFFDDGGAYLLLIDEAHNLVDRARQNFSAALSCTPLREAAALLPPAGDAARLMNKLIRGMQQLRQTCLPANHLASKAPMVNFNRLVGKLIDALDEWLARQAEPAPDALMAVYFDLLRWQRTAEVYDTRYITLIETDGGESTAQQLCLDPSARLQGILDRVKAAVFFSATLSPMNYYIDVLGGGAQAQKKTLPSPYRREHLCVLIADRIRTVYQDREDTLVDVADCIYYTAAARHGNYMVYFSSYAYLEAVYDEFRELYPQMHTVRQTAGMEDAEREAFLTQFRDDNPHTLIGFCVLGGLYAEGIDLRGNRLIGAIVVGTGLPGLSTERDLLQSYYEHRSGNGFAFAYRYPGMNRVLQAAGRVIRSETDRGVVVLIDERFGSSGCRALLPEHWHGYAAVRTPQDIGRRLAAFWTDAKQHDPAAHTNPTAAGTFLAAVRPYPASVP